MLSNTVLLADGKTKKCSVLDYYNQILNPDGDVANIIDKKIKKDVDVYEIKPKTGKPFYVTEDTIIPFYCNGEKIRAAFKEIVSLKDDKLIAKKSFKIAHNKSINFMNNISLPISPRLFGYILCNTSSTTGTVRITLNEKDSPGIEYKKFVEKYINENGLMLSKVKGQPDNTNSYQIINKEKNIKKKNPLYTLLEEFGLARTKVPDRFIPDMYKVASESERLELLASICDTSGYINGNSYQLLLSSEQLANDIAFVARTLGLTASVNKVIKSKKEYFNITIGGDVWKIPCLVKKKKMAMPNSRKDLLIRNFDIKYLGKQTIVEIKVDDDYLLDDCTIL